VFVRWIRDCNLSGFFVSNRIEAMESRLWAPQSRKCSLLYAQNKRVCIESFIKEATPEDRLNLIRLLTS